MEVFLILMNQNYYTWHAFDIWCKMLFIVFVHPSHAAATRRLVWQFLFVICWGNIVISVVHMRFSMMLCVMAAATRVIRETYSRSCISIDRWRCQWLSRSAQLANVKLIAIVWFTPQCRERGNILITFTSYHPDVAIRDNRGECLK